MGVHSRIDLGAVKIHRNVIISISSMAALEIEGVKEIGRNKAFNMAEILGLKGSTGIEVDFGKNDEIKMEIPLVVKYGYNIPEIAERVQENVRITLEKMIDKTPQDININIQGIEK